MEDVGGRCLFQEIDSYEDDSQGFFDLMTHLSFDPNQDYPNSNSGQRWLLSRYRDWKPATFLWYCIIIFSIVLICWSMIIVIRIKKLYVTHVQLQVKSWKWFSCSTCQPSFCQNNFSLELFARWHFPGLHHRRTVAYLVQIWGGKQCYSD